MYKLIIIAALVAYCLAAPADNYRGSLLLNPNPFYRRQIAPFFKPDSREDSIESDETWGVDKREAPRTEPVLEADQTSENPFEPKIRDINEESSVRMGNPDFVLRASAGV